MPAVYHSNKKRPLHHHPGQYSYTTVRSSTVLLLTVTTTIIITTHTHHYFVLSTCRRRASITTGYKPVTGQSRNLLTSFLFETTMNTILRRREHVRPSSPWCKGFHCLFAKSDGLAFSLATIIFSLTSVSFRFCCAHRGLGVTANATVGLNRSMSPE
jgi:hypothetical protein